MDFLQIPVALLGSLHREKNTHLLIPYIIMLDIGGQLRNSG
jgi:hypothetical protein